MALRDKYNHAIQTAKQLGFDGSAEERDGKLYFNGTAKSEDDKNRIWNALKTVPDWQKDISADIRVKPGAATPTAAPSAQAPAAAAPQAQQTYTVQSGDTLSGIAKKLLGNAAEYMDIYNANRDQLTDPDKIKPGQVLKIPQATHR